MRVVIIGAGKVGFNIGQILSNENHDVVIIEKNEERYRIIQESLDVQAINGSGASSQVLEEADIRAADLLIAVTEYDELNMISCILAKQYGVPRTIARVRNPEYADNNLLTKGSVLGIDLVINPEKVTAWEISQLIDVPEALDVEYYADGKIQLLELEIDQKAPIIDKYLKDLKFPYRFVIVAILRDEKMIIPRGDDIIKKNDIIFLLAKTQDMVDIERYMGKERAKTKNVMILGGGRIGYYLAKILETKKMGVKIIEKNLQRCKEISQSLDSTLVLHGDGSDIDLLKEEGAGQIDTFVALTEDDKLNLLVSLLAKHLGVKKTIAQIRRSDYLPLVERVGIDVAVSPRLLTASAILKFIRKGHIINVSLLSGDKAEMIELAVTEKSKIVNKYLRDLNFPKGAIIGSIYRDDDVFIPTGNDYIIPGDRIIVFALPKAIHKVEEFFSE